MTENRPISWKAKQRSLPKNLRGEDNSVRVIVRCSGRRVARIVARDGDRVLITALTQQRGGVNLDHPERGLGIAEIVIECPHEAHETHLLDRARLLEVAEGYQGHVLNVDVRRVAAFV